MLLWRESTITRSRARSRHASVLVTLVNASILSRRMDCALHLVRTLALLRLASKLQTTAHLRIIIGFCKRRLLKDLHFLLDAPAFLLTLPP